MKGRQFSTEGRLSANKSGVGDGAGSVSGVGAEGGSAAFQKKERQKTLKV